LRKSLLIGSTGGNRSLWLSLTSAGTGFRTKSINRVPHFLLVLDHALDVSTISSVLKTVIVLVEARIQSLLALVSLTRIPKK